MNKKKINLNSVPEKPGCYLWKDINNEVIYVGKAINLKNRMSQYFNLKYDNFPKTKILVQQIFDYEYKVVENEREALLLELNLIKKYNPKFNIRLHDVATYPYLCLTKKPKTKLDIAYKYKKSDNLKCYGPFPEGFGPNRMKKLLESLYPINKCLGDNNKNKQQKPCLNYQIDLCLGYCFKSQNEISKKQNKLFNDINNILSGETDLLKKQIIKKIDFYSKQKMYEESSKLYKSLELIEKYKQQQLIYLENNESIDLISWAYKNNVLSITFFYIRNGVLVDTKNKLLNSFTFDFYETVINYLNNYYQNNFIPDCIYLDDIENNLTEKNFLFSFQTLLNDDKKILMNKVREEAKNFLKYEGDIFVLKYDQENEVKSIFKKILKVNNIHHIEMIDISNHQGKNQVGVIASFKDLSPNYSEFRFYNLDDKQDDYASTYEVTYRHFRQKLLKKLPIPNIFLVDGKYQINYAKKALDDLNIKDVDLFGLIKNKKHETSSLIDLKNHFYNINDDKILLKLKQMQEQTHSYAIKKFRNKKERDIFQNG